MPALYAKQKYIATKVFILTILYIVKYNFPRQTGGAKIMRIELENNDKMARAAKRARASRLLVQVLAFRNYRVTNLKSGTVYVVTFSVEGARRFGSCECKANANNLLCLHIAAAAARHLVAAAEIAAAQTAAAPAPLMAREQDNSILIKPSAAAPAKYRGVEL